ncbi:hypothetical protein [Roseibium alexandrii]|uniref:hypothetical protein n=1 Tax=Roseibium alexandrii TaxID=388408 RepID=UPI003752D1B2
MITTRFKPEPDQAEKTADTMRRLVNQYGGTDRVAEIMNVPEAWIWNRLPADDREVKK